MARARLSGRVGAALDPCARDPGRVRAGRRRGARDRLPARRRAAMPTTRARLVQRFRGTGRRRTARSRRCARTGSARSARCRWKRPDASLNVLANGWLLYQTLACRLWARSGFYQSGGAFGFRDQLQDVMALVHAEPGARARAPACAARAASSRKATSSTGGIRRRAAACARTARTTTCGCRWRRAATCEATGDSGVLDEPVPFLEGRPVNAERGLLLRPAAPVRGSGQRSTSTACAPILHGLRFGAHGLPLMGSGDWNDGMNLVGEQGQGRKRLARLLPVRRARRSSPRSRAARGDAAFAERCEAEARQAAPQSRAARLGRRVVPARLLRRRHAAGLGEQRRMPDRFDRAELVGAVGRGRCRARAHGDGRGRRAARAPRRRADPAARSAVRHVEPRSRLHQGLCARRARERRPVHARARSGRRWRSRRWATHAARGSSRR